MTRGVLALVASLVWLAPAVAGAQGMLSSKHNLSLRGPGPIKAVSETQICVFCHTPHNSNPAAPLWNKQLSGQSYTAYSSNTLQASPGQPNGYSKLCLSCHDGSLAIGSVRNLGGQSATIQMSNAAANGAMPTSSTALLGTNLSNDHPISFIFNSTVYSQDGELVDPSTLGPTSRIRLYPGDTGVTREWVQCTTCHDPHLIVNPYFLKKAFTGRTDNLCLTCHIKPGWANSSHESATSKQLGGTAVSELSCGACHRPHVTEGMPRLLRGSPSGVTAPAIEQACYRCHAGTGTTPATYNLQAQFAKTKSLHRITSYPLSGDPGHQPVFTKAGPLTLLDTAPERVANNNKHVECTDCHNPHRVTPRGTDTTCGGRFTGRNDVACSGRYRGMRGIQADGTLRDDVTQDSSPAQWEICFRCHGDTYATAVKGSLAGMDGDKGGTPPNLTQAPAAVPVSNKRIEFQTTNSAYHPVTGAGRNTSDNLNQQFAWLSSQSKQPSSTSSRIICTDCHNNDYYNSANGYVGTIGASVNQTQPIGPHGSNNFNLLRARVWNSLPGPTTYSSANFDLCFHCHDVNKLTGIAGGSPDPRDFGSGARTNFDDEGGGLTRGRGKANLHYYHLRTKVDKTATVCKDCHFNVHSNKESPNTQYRIVSGSTSCSPGNGTLTTTPPDGTPTRLVNFRPTVIGKHSTRPSGDKPEWCFNTTTKERRCFLMCHNLAGTAIETSRGEYVMDGYSYKPPSGDLP